MCAQQKTLPQSRLSELSILVADDDPVIRKLFARRLEDAGYQVRIAADGLEAARMIRSTRFDVVLTDLVMPGDIGGIELLQIARDRDINTEVIVITAHSSVDTAVAAMKKGAADYLEKPVNFDELFLRLDKIAQVRALMRNAGDLREAMAVTEAAAARTIQDLEITVGDLRIIQDRITDLLVDSSLSSEERIRLAIQLLKQKK